MPGDGQFRALASLGCLIMAVVAFLFLILLLWPTSHPY